MVIESGNLERRVGVLGNEALALVDDSLCEIVAFVLREYMHHQMSSNDYPISSLSHVFNYDKITQRVAKARANVYMHGIDTLSQSVRLLPGLPLAALTVPSPLSEH
jgi:hypothetical protein